MNKVKFVVKTDVMSSRRNNNPLGKTAWLTAAKEIWFSAIFVFANRVDVYVANLR